MTDGPLTTPQFFARNDALARAYKTARPSERTDILERLYTIDLPVFQAWRLAPHNRDDFRQEAVLYLARALETYQPDKGPFIAWLRNYVKKTFESHGKQRDLGHDEIGETLSSPQEDPPDTLFWDRAKELCTEHEWHLVEMRFRDGLGVEEIARSLGTYPERVRKPLTAALDKIKCASFTTEKNHHASPKKYSSLDPREAAWIRKRDLCKKLGLSAQQVKDMLDPGRDPHHSPCQIDPRDVARFPSVRIRFLESDAGLVYPRIIRRGTTIGSAAGRGGLL